ncbi:hypothetical protein BD310DRAFT_132725 [Dichomitus squalens]|uniref:Uncharacterized protein n=1 Tax=Dichomitus squalens TaxID=114155 RepID=A0A4V2K6W3_9APHY|nr:hypothetical protein BD310DRAFT_132725 [Dichomitus squalens]
MNFGSAFAIIRRPWVEHLAFPSRMICPRAHLPSANHREGPLEFPQDTPDADQLGNLHVGLKGHLVGLFWLQKHNTAFGVDCTKKSSAISIVQLYVYSRLAEYGFRESASAGSNPRLLEKSKTFSCATRRHARM